MYKHVYKVKQEKCVTATERLVTRNMRDSDVFLESEKLPHSFNGKRVGVQFWVLVGG